MFTVKQEFALDLLNDKQKTFYLFDGSSRSGKTYAMIKFILIYGMKYKGLKAIIGRYRFNHAKASIWQQTLLPILEDQYKGYYEINKSDYIVNMSWGSQIYLGGFESGERLDKILGTEWGLILMNEGTENSYDTYQLLKTRLNDKNIKTKFLIDCNPKSPANWLHKLFIEYINPETKEKLEKSQVKKHCRLNWNVYDNEQNLGSEYIETLSELTGVKRKRFFQGIWSESEGGTVYRFTREVNHSDKPIEYNKNAKVWACWDFGISDLTFIIWFQIVPIPKTDKNKHGIEIQIFDEYYNNGKDYDFYAEVVNAKGRDNIQHCGDPSGTSRNASLQSWFSLLATKGIHLSRRTEFSVPDQIANVNFYMQAIKICELQCPKTVEMFENWSKPKDKDGKIMEDKLPIHDEHSHPGTALFYGFANALPPVKNEIFLP